MQFKIKSKNFPIVAGGSVLMIGIMKEPSCGKTVRFPLLLIGRWESRIIWERRIVGGYMDSPCSLN